MPVKTWIGKVCPGVSGSVSQGGGRKSAVETYSQCYCHFDPEDLRELLDGAMSGQAGTWDTKFRSVIVVVVTKVGNAILVSLSLVWVYSHCLDVTTIILIMSFPADTAVSF